MQYPPENGNPSTIVGVRSLKYVLLVHTFQTILAQIYLIYTEQ